MNARSSELVADARTKTAELHKLAKDGAHVDDLLAAAYLDGYNACLHDREAITGEHRLDFRDLGDQSDGLR